MTPYGVFIANIDQVGWLVGDVACLALMVVFLPLVPVFKAFDRGRHAGKDE